MIVFETTEEKMIEAGAKLAKYCKKLKKEGILIDWAVQCIPGAQVA